jgi:hypothetical protein
MQIKTQGFEITGVAGVEKITICPVKLDAVNPYVETVVMFNSLDMAISFDLVGLRDFLDGITEAERLASSLDIQVQSARREA